MSAHDYVFLEPIRPMTESELVADLNARLGTNFVEQPSEYAKYLSSSSGLALDLGTHDFENDRDMLFEEYPYVITVRKIGRNAEFQTAAARRAFDALKAAGRYRLLLVSDLQSKLDEFDPQGASPTRGSGPPTPPRPDRSGAQ
jgi:hypothetical protein